MDTTSYMDAAIEQVRNERAYQNSRWGDLDDRQNMPNDFIAYMNHYGTRWFNGQVAPYDTETLYRFYDSMIKVAAIAIGAAEYAGKLLNGDNSRPDVLTIAANNDDAA